jgi:GntR family transcriptional regulator, transcriptional repressor for pyruvate dehydrogenase complex
VAIDGFKKVVLNRKSDYIVEQIYQALLRGDIKPEERLSSESELAETFGTSKLTVREAVRSLEQMGILEVRKGGSGGLFVREVDLNSTVNHLERIMLLPNITVPELTATRVALETYIIRDGLSREKVTPDVLLQMESNIAAAVQFFKEGKKDLERLRTNFDFHLMMSTLTDNNMLIILHRLTCEMLIRFYQLARPSREMAEKTISYHRQILAALRSGDFERAAEVNVEHIWEASKRITEKSKEQSFLRLGE